MVTPGPRGAARLTGLFLVVHIQLFVFLLDVTLIEHHDDAHHPGRHGAGGKDDKADDNKEKVVPGAQSLVTQRPKLDAHLAQTTALHVSR